MPNAITSKNIQGISDLVIWAPIKQGFIPAFENVTYETRLRLMAKAFYKLRNYAREYELIKPFTDTAERIQSLLAFRIGILETSPRSLILAATFDRPWEPYMRLIWYPLGEFLNVLLCNCEGYVPATRTNFKEYDAWVRGQQVDSVIFYATSPLTVGDGQYLMQMEKLQREAVGDPTRALTTMTQQDPEDIAEMVRSRATCGASNFDPNARRDFLTLCGEGLEVLHRLADYYPPDDPEGDGKYLLGATRSLFQGFDSTKKSQLPDEFRQTKKVVFEWFKPDDDPLPPKSVDPICDPSEVQMGILEDYGLQEQTAQQGCLLMFTVTDTDKAREFINGLIDQVSWSAREPTCASISPGKDVAQGRSTADDLLTKAIGYRKASSPGANIYVNFAVTYPGLNNLGVDQETVGQFPPEFCQGMSERAPLLGDIARNHPGRWTGPERFARGKARAKSEPRVELSEVDFIIQLRTNADQTGYCPVPNTLEGLKAQKKGVLPNKILEILRECADGATLIAIQPMRRCSFALEGGPVKTRDHFGFADIISQPSLDGKQDDGRPAIARDCVKRGELLLGYGNDRGDPPFKAGEGDFLKNGSFLVIRKISQDVTAFEKFLTKTTDDEPSLSSEGLLAKLVGRDREGNPLKDPPGADPQSNDFNFKGDPKGETCPFQAHIRRANPRLSLVDNPQLGRPTPRIMRRGMSYGPTIDEEGTAKPRTEAPDDRGVIFMAYNASIAEQYEVIQRWINGGNSTNIPTMQNDPIFGTHPAEGPKILRFMNKGEAVRVIMDDPLVSLMWGLYLFAPSKSALRVIARSSSRGASSQTENPSREEGLEAPRQRDDSPPPTAGEAILSALLPDDPVREGAGRKATGAKVDAKAEGATFELPFDWKVYLEDFTAKDPGERGDSPSLWSAINADQRLQKGVARIPESNFVLVTDGDLIHDILVDPARYSDPTKALYSVRGQKTRMNDSIGEIYIGLDDGEEYISQSGSTNELIMNVSEERAFEVAFDAAWHALEAVWVGNKLLSDGLGADFLIEFDLRNDFLTPTLAEICKAWFGLPDSSLYPFRQIDPKGDAPFIEAGGWDWKSVEGKQGRKPRCPGDFMSPSRYCFYPDPTNTIIDYGKAHGQALRKAARAYFGSYRAKGETPPGALTGPMFEEMFDRDDGLYSDEKVDLLARTVIGIMTGALPPIDGNLRGVLYDWLENKTFWRWQNQWRIKQDDAETSNEGRYQAAKDSLRTPMIQGMQARPAPDLIWRTALEDHDLGGVAVDKDDKIILVLVAATHAALNDKKSDDESISLVFGGWRPKNEAKKDSANGSGAKPPEPQFPLHACPAREMAMGTMLGILAALMSAGQIEALPAPLLVRLTPNEDLNRAAAGKTKTLKVVSDLNAKLGQTLAAIEMDLEAEATTDHAVESPSLYGRVARRVRTTLSDFVTGPIFRPTPQPAEESVVAEDPESPSS